MIRYKFIGSLNEPVLTAVESVQKLLTDSYSPGQAFPIEVLDCLSGLLLNLGAPRQIIPELAVLDLAHLKQEVARHLHLENAEGAITMLYSTYELFIAEEEKKAKDPEEQPVRKQEIFRLTDPEKHQKYAQALVRAAQERGDRTENAHLFVFLILNYLFIQDRQWFTDTFLPILADCEQRIMKRSEWDDTDYEVLNVILSARNATDTLTESAFFLSLAASPTESIIEAFYKMDATDRLQNSIFFLKYLTITGNNDKIPPLMEGLKTELENTFWGEATKSPVDTSPSITRYNTPQKRIKIHTELLTIPLALYMLAFPDDPGFTAKIEKLTSTLSDELKKQFSVDLSNITVRDLVVNYSELLNKTHTELYQSLSSQMPISDRVIEDRRDKVTLYSKSQMYITLASLYLHLSHLRIGIHADLKTMHASFTGLQREIDSRVPHELISGLSYFQFAPQFRRIDKNKEAFTAYPEIYFAELLKINRYNPELLLRTVREFVPLLEHRRSDTYQLIKKSALFAYKKTEAVPESQLRGIMGLIASGRLPLQLRRQIAAKLCHKSFLLAYLLAGTTREKPEIARDILKLYQEYPKQSPAEQRLCQVYFGETEASELTHKLESTKRSLETVVEAEDQRRARAARQIIATLRGIAEKTAWLEEEREISLVTEEETGHAVREAIKLDRAQRQENAMVASYEAACRRMIDLAPHLGTIEEDTDRLIADSEELIGHAAGISIEQADTPGFRQLKDTCRSAGIKLTASLKELSGLNTEFETAWEQMEELASTLTHKKDHLVSKENAHRLTQATEQLMAKVVDVLDAIERIAAAKEDSQEYIRQLELTLSRLGRLEHAAERKRLEEEEAAQEQKTRRTLQAMGGSLPPQDKLEREVRDLRRDFSLRHLPEALQPTGSLITFTPDQFRHLPLKNFFRQVQAENTGRYLEFRLETDGKPITGRLDRNGVFTVTSHALSDSKVLAAINKLLLSLLLTEPAPITYSSPNGEIRSFMPHKAAHLEKIGHHFVTDYPYSNEFVIYYDGERIDGPEVELVLAEHTCFMVTVLQEGKPGAGRLLRLDALTDEEAQVMLAQEKPVIGHFRYTPFHTRPAGNEDNIPQRIQKYIETQLQPDYPDKSWQDIRDGIARGEIEDSFLKPDPEQQGKVYFGRDQAMIETESGQEIRYASRERTLIFPYIRFFPFISSSGNGDQEE